MKINSNIQFLYDANRFCLIVDDPQNIQREDASPVTNFKTLFFTIKARDYRLKIGQTNEWQSRYTRYVPVLTLTGMREIAQYYNEKYFGPQGRSDRKIFVAQGLEEMDTLFQDFFNTPKLKTIGLTCPRVIQPGGEESHPVTIIADKQAEGPVKIYLADGSPSGSSFDRSFCGIEVINQKLQNDQVVIYNIQHARQASLGHCKSEALLFLKNALQLDTIFDHILSFNKENFKVFKERHRYENSLNRVSWTPSKKLNELLSGEKRQFFICKPSLLKTLQKSSYLNVLEGEILKQSANNPEIKLENTKDREEYKAFFARSRAKARYYWFECSKTEQKHIFTIQPGNYCDLEENGYLAHKAMEHYVFLAQKLEDRKAV